MDGYRATCAVIYRLRGVGLLKHELREGTCLHCADQMQKIAMRQRGLQVDPVRMRSTRIVSSNMVYAALDATYAYVEVQPASTCASYAGIVERIARFNQF